MRRVVRNKIVAFIMAAAMVGAGFPGMQFTSYADSSVTFTFTDSGITASGSSSGYVIDGTELTITSAGTYTITGSCSEGTVVVKKATTGVTLVLDDLDLTASATAPVVIKKTAEVTLDIEGEVNLTDTEDPANEESTDEEVADAFEGAGIKAKDGSSLTITGDGTLNVDGSTCKNGIKAGAETTITINGATINVNAYNNGIASDNAVVINDGTITVNAEGDGIKSEPDEDDTVSAGTVTINGGDITVTATDDGISAYGDNTITDGTIDVTAGGDAIKSDSNTTITGGTLTIDAGDDGIHADYITTIGTSGSSSGPDITVLNSYETIEGAIVNLYSGSAETYASDDGINAANSDLTNYSFAINIAGGSWYIDAEGDGLDANGDIYMTGGEIAVFGASTNEDANTAVDFDGSFTYTSGTLAAVGLTPGMEAITPTSGAYIVFNGSTTSSTSFSGGQNQGGPGVQVGPGGQGGGQGHTGGNTQIISANDYVTVSDSSGNALYSFVAPKAATYMYFCQDDVVSSSTYYLTISEVEEEIPDTLYFKNSAGWSQVYAYMWNSTSTASNASWPGSAMTLVDSTNAVYSISTESSSVNYKYIIFDNGSSGSGNQTADLTIPTDGTNCYDSSTGTWSTYEEAQVVSVTGVSLSSSSLTLSVGDTSTLTATVTPSDADDTSVSWSSSNTSVATVSSSGVVTAVAAGTATITVTTTDGSYTATCAVTVNEDEEEALVNNSFISQEAVVGEKIVFKGAATGGSGEYEYAYYYRKTTDTSWTTAGTEWGTAIYATAKPGSNTVYEVCIKVRDANNTSNIVKKYLSFAANNTETSLKCYGSVYKTIYKYGITNYITASSEGNADGSTVQYKYEYRKASSWTYETIKDYTTDTKVSWDAPQTGSFTLRITAYDGTDYAIRTINIKVKPAS